MNNVYSICKTSYGNQTAYKRNQLKLKQGINIWNINPHNNCTCKKKSQNSGNNYKKHPYWGTKFYCVDLTLLHHSITKAENTPSIRKVTPDTAIINFLLGFTGFSREVGCSTTFNINMLFLSDFS